MIKLDNYTIIIILNHFISYKSQLCLSLVSKDFKNYIILKKYSFYQNFKKILRNINKKLLIEILFESDEEFVQNEIYFPIFYNIKNHKYGNNLKNYVLNYKFYCIIKFKKKINKKIKNNKKINDLENYASNHCQWYSTYRPLQGLLTQLCLDFV